MAALLTPPGFASLSGVTAIQNGEPLAVNSCKQGSWFTTYTSTPSDGTIIIEMAATRDYAGIWIQLDEIDCSLLPAANPPGSGTYPGVLNFMRARISETVVGGTVSVYLNGLQEV
jgi:hypothetical protein